MKAINQFVSVADDLFGPITIIRKDGKIVKKIPWSAFKFAAVDWERVKDCKVILEVRQYVLFLKTLLMLINRTRTPSSNYSRPARMFQFTR